MRKNKNRHKRNLNKKISTAGKSKRYSKAAKEPWVLVTSLSQARDNPVHIVNIYRQRMRIEENFRDTKCFHYGQGLMHSLTKRPERMAILLLIAAIAIWAAWLAGLITTLQGNASDFQAHSAKFTNSYGKGNFALGGCLLPLRVHPLALALVLLRFYCRGNCGLNQVV